MNNRLKQFIAAENITQAQFADNINVVRASVSHVLSGRNNPGYDFIKAIMTAYPRLNIEWLMLGKGKMYKDDSPIVISEEPLLFSDSAPEMAFAHEDAPTARENIKNDMRKGNSEMNTSEEKVQHIVKERKALKVFILYDDGTFQEI